MAVAGRGRVRRAGSVLAATLVLAAALPAAALAQQGTSNPFGPLPQNSGTVPNTTSTSAPPVLQPTTTAGSSSVNGAGIAAIAVGAIVILVGISFFIWRDARKRAPVKERTAAAAAGAGSKPRAKSRKLSPAERRRRKRGRAR